VKPYVSLTELGIPMDLNFFRQSILHTSNSKFNTIAETTLDDVRRECFNIGKSYTKDELYNMVKDAKRVADIKNSDGYHYNDLNAFKRLCITSGNWYGYHGEKYFYDITKHISNQKDCKWNLELAKKEAKKYKSIGESQKKNPSLYHWVNNNNLRDEVYSHCFLRKQWTKELALQECKKIKDYSVFAKDIKLSSAVKRFDCLEEATSHMNKRKKWNIEEVKKLQKGFIYDIDFRRAHPQAHCAAVRFGLRLKMK
jgi:hypothetical protein